jgi:hypothetical protein
MRTIEVTDYLGDEWSFLPGPQYKKNRHGLTEMWLWVAKGPKAMKDYQQIPFPVFTEWFE